VQIPSSKYTTKLARDYCKLVQICSFYYPIRYTLVAHKNVPDFKNKMEEKKGLNVWTWCLIVGDK
jgi:hypothetical protein